MGHSINHYTRKVTTKKDLQAFIDEITENAFDPQETDSYHGNLTVHEITVYENYDAALKAIEAYDNDWYDDHIVQFWGISEEGRKKIQEMNAKRDDYINNHSIHLRSSKYIGCPVCGSKLYLGYIKGEKCPLCGMDLRASSTIEKIKWYDQKAKEIAAKYKTKYWLAKIEYHG